MKRTISLVVGVTLCGVFASPDAAAPDPLNQQSAISHQQSVMIVDGESGGPYHRWQVTTPVLKTILAETRLFTVDVATAPATTGEMTGFSPPLAGHGALPVLAHETASLP